MFLWAYSINLMDLVVKYDLSKGNGFIWVEETFHADFKGEIQRMMLFNEQKKIVDAHSVNV